MGLLASLKGALGKSKPADEELDRNVEEEIARHLWVSGRPAAELPPEDLLSCT